MQPLAAVRPFTAPPAGPEPLVIPPRPGDVWSLPQVARRVGLSVERFRKVRKAWTRDRDFPAELNEPGESPVFDACAIERWVARRAARVTAAAVDAPPPETSADRKAGAAAAIEGRKRLRQLKGA